jgi:hypothetical protein
MPEFAADLGTRADDRSGLTGAVSVRISSLPEEVAIVTVGESPPSVPAVPASEPGLHAPGWSSTSCGACGSSKVSSSVAARAGAGARALRAA